MLQDLVKDKNKLTLVDENNNSVLTDDQSVSTLIDNLFSETNIILSDLEKNVLKIEDVNNEDGENNEDEDFISQEL
jgi:hypothetical protein